MSVKEFRRPLHVCFMELILLIIIAAIAIGVLRKDITPELLGSVGGPGTGVGLVGLVWVIVGSINKAL